METYDAEHVELHAVRLDAYIFCSPGSGTTVQGTLFSEILDIRAADILRIMGFRFSGLLAAITLPLFLVAILFSGPLLLAWYHQTLLRRVTNTPVAIRNLIAAPITEELCFRSGLISFLLASHVSPSRALWLSPLPFALSHVHHVVDLIVHQGWHPADATARCLFQAVYTTIFGWLAAFFLLRTGHYAALVVTHSFCNYMGFPDFGAVANHPRSKELIVAFLGGILGFIVLLKPLTSPSLYGFPSTESSGYVIFFK
ncbi:putative CAAX prenyl protease 2 [Nannochloris sp. 'desiccata']|nr:putative CAAX prenyl protease 2 [Chlorella desiccata (nom. nud.)]